MSEKIKKTRKELSSDIISALGSGSNVIGGGIAIIRDKAPAVRTTGFGSDVCSNIDTDPQGSWTGVPTDDPYSKPIQDADDL